MTPVEALRLRNSTMMWKAVFENAMAALVFYKRRSIITMISLAWAVASFLILMSYGTGFDSAMRLSFVAVGRTWS